MKMPLVNLNLTVDVTKQIQNIIDTLPFRDMPFCIFASSTSTRIKNDKIKDMGCDKATVISA